MISTNWPSPCRARSQRRISVATSSSRPMSGVRWRCPARRPPPLARTSRYSVTGSSTPLSSWLPRSSTTNRPATWRCTRAVTTTAPGSANACTPPRPCSSHPRPPLRRFSHTAINPTRRVDHYRAGFDANAGVELRLARTGILAVNLSERPLDRKGSPRCAFCVVFLRYRIAEQRHQPVTQLFGDVTADLRHRRRGSIQIRADQIAPLLGIELGRNIGRTNQIAEHHSQEPAFAARSDLARD